MIWILLLLNTTTAVIALRRRVLPYSILTAIFIVLVIGQAVQMQADFGQESTLYYAFSTISLQGFHYALWYVFGVSVISLILCARAKGYRRGSQPKPLYQFDPPTSFYIVLVGALGIVSGILIFGVVGLSSFLEKSRPGNVPGATLFIVLMSVGVFPLLLKLLFPGRVRFGDIVGFLIAVAVSAGFTRLHVVLYLLILLIVLFYGRGWADRTIGLRIILVFSIFAVLLTAFFFAVGAIRGALSFTHGSITDLIDYNLDHPSTSLLSVQYNYRIGVEGMSGLSGAMSDALLDPGEVHHDYGLVSVVNGFEAMMPNAIKRETRDISKEVAAMYWYQKPPGNISPGLESSYVSFGWFGMILYPCLFFLFYWVFPVFVLPRRLSPPLKLSCFVWFGCGIFFVRGSWEQCIAFCISYFIIIYVCWIVFAFWFTRVEEEKPCEIEDRTG